MLYPIMLDTILKNTYTKTDALKRLRILKEFVSLKLFGAEDQTETGTLKDRFLEEDLIWLNNIFGQDVTKINKQDLSKQFEANNVYHQFEQWEETIKNTQTLTLYIPITIPDQSIIQVGQYLRQSYGQNFLIDLKYDPTLVAGVALVWKGVYKDYSIRQKLQQNREKVTSLIKGMIGK